MGEPSSTATKDWVLPGSGAGCKVTGGGRITTTDGDKATFGGNAKGAGPSGQEEYQDHGPSAAMNLHSIDVQAVVCSEDGLSASIFGTATIDGTGSVDYRIDVTDNGEPGSSDTYEIRLSNGYDSGVQTLVGGNIQVHKPGGGAVHAATKSSGAATVHASTSDRKAAAPRGPKGGHAATAHQSGKPPKGSKSR